MQCRACPDVTELTARVLDRVQQHDLVEAVAEDGDALVAAQAHEAGQEVQLLVRAHADAHAADRLCLVLHDRNAACFKQA